MLFLPFGVLGIETSCDETAGSGHRKWARLAWLNGRHANGNSCPLWRRLPGRWLSRQPCACDCACGRRCLIEGASRVINDIDAVAVTRGPGWPVRFVIVVCERRQRLALGAGLPLIGVNHLWRDIFIRPGVYNSGDTPPEEPAISP